MLILTLVKGQVIILMATSEFEVPPILKTSIAYFFLLLFLIEKYSSCD